MIKFRIHPSIEEGERCKFEEVLKKCQNYRLFDIFLDILHKMKENLSQEHVKGRLLSFQGKNWNNFAFYPWKMTAFPVLTLFFQPSLPKIWLSHLLVDPGVPKRPIRFKSSVRTGNPFLWVSQSLPVNEATGRPPTVKCKQTKKSVGSRNACIADSTLWSSCSRSNKFECGG